MGGLGSISFFLLVFFPRRTIPEWYFHCLLAAGGREGERGGVPVPLVAVDPPSRPS